MITLRNITLRRGTKVVLDDASVTLQPGEKIGLWAAMAPASRACSPC